MNKALGRVVCVVAGLHAGAEAQSSWASVATTTGPVSGYGHAMAYDSQRGRTVMLTNGIYPSCDTWEWDGTSWTLITNTGPATRLYHAMAYDSQRGLTVLFGGSLVGIPYGDTWEWNGSTWTQVATSGPMSGYGYAMAYDSQRGRIVLFGDGTWEWDGNSWAQVAITGPTATGRGFSAMAYDSQRGRTVLFGGSNGNPFGDTWEWDGLVWAQVATVGPSARSGHTMAYDSQRRKVVLFGGGPNPFWSYPFSDTWQWDGSRWTQVPTTGPSTSWQQGMAYDSRRGRTVLKGASGTWELALPISAEFTAFGQGCPGPVGTPLLTAAPGSLPIIGQTLQMQLTNLPPNIFAFPFGAVGFSDQIFNGVPLPAPMDTIGAPGCILFVSIDQEFVLSNQSGAAAWNIPVPFDPSLLGLDAYLQGAVLVLGFNAANLVVANAAHAVIGSF